MRLSIRVQRFACMRSCAHRTVGERITVGQRITVWRAPDTRIRVYTSAATPVRQYSRRRPTTTTTTASPPRAHRHKRCRRRRRPAFYLNTRARHSRDRRPVPTTRGDLFAAAADVDVFFSCLFSSCRRSTHKI